MEINADYVIRRTILFDNKCGFVLGENPKAPNPYVTWQFNEQDGHRDYFWGCLLYTSRPGIRPYQTQNIYAPFTQRGAAGKEDAIENSKKPKARPRKGR